jgi:hypothetical protein
MEVGARRGAHFQPRTSITMTMSPSRQNSLACMNQRECRKLRPTSVLQFFVVSGISKPHAGVVAAGWLQRIPSDARMMKTHGRISLVTGPGEKWL